MGNDNDVVISVLTELVVVIRQLFQKNATVFLYKVTTSEPEVQIFFEQNSEIILLHLWAFLEMCIALNKSKTFALILDYAMEQGESMDLELLEALMHDNVTQFFSEEKKHLHHTVRMGKLQQISWAITSAKREQSRPYISASAGSVE